jgi:hypothetical protein
VRRELVEPLNELLHRAQPRAWETMVIEDVLALYAPELAADPAFRREKEAALARFLDIEYASCVIAEVEPRPEERLAARVRLRLRGRTPAGGRLSTESWHEQLCARGDRGWIIAAESALAPEETAASDDVSFREEAESRGLRFLHRSGGVLDRAGVPQSYSPGSGLAVGDHDADGDDDVFLVGGDESRLFENQDDGTFADVTARSGIAHGPAGEARCAVFADYDNDGRLDLFVGRLEAPNLLYRNLGGGRFEDAAERAGIVSPPELFEATSACFADFDRDGWLDLYVGNGGNFLRTHPDPPYNALNAAPNQLWMSNRDGTFTERTEHAGVGHTGFALAVAASDYDLDGDMDIFVANDVGFDVLYRNRGDATFDDVTHEAGIRYRGTSMSAAWGDYDADGDPDLFVAGMDSNSAWILDQPAFPAPAPWYVSFPFRPAVLAVFREMLWGNRLYENNGDGTFDEVSEAAGVRRNGWAWAAVFLDHDNDGDLDLYGTNGFISGEDPKDL